MLTYLALYRGPSIERAELVAVSTDAELISHVAGAILQEGIKSNEEPTDPAVASLVKGRQRALRIVLRGSKDRKG